MTPAKDRDRASIPNDRRSILGSWLRIYPLITLVLMLLLTTIWIVIFASSRIAEKSETDRIYSSIIHEAALFAEYMNLAFKSVESKIDIVAYALRLDQSPNLVKELVDQKIIVMDSLHQIAHVDLDARTLSTNLGPDTNLTPLHDREHIRVHLDGTVDGIFISKPVQGRVSKKWSIQITKKISGSDRKAAGVVVGSMDPYFLQKFWENHLFLESIAVELIGEDGYLRSRSELLTGALEEPHVYANTYRTPKITIDNIDYKEPRLISVQRLAGYPLYVKASLPTSYFDQQLRDATWPLFYVGFASSLSLGLIGLFLVNSTRRLEENSTTLKKQIVQLVKMAEDTHNISTAKASFLATMSHEIRTPLHAIIGISDIIWEKQELDLSLLSIIRTSGKHLLEVVNDILDFSEVNSGRMKMHLEVFDLRELIQEVSAITKQLSTKESVQFKTENIVDSVWVTGDRRRITQCLLNLLSNAIKFTDRGHIKLTIRISNLSPSSKTVCLMVYDTGIGMAEPTLLKAFKPIDQDYSKITHVRGGAGLGLPITNKLIELMNGKLVIDSHLGKGTQCAIYLDLSVAVQPGSKDALNNEDAVYSMKPLSILLADDVESARYFARLILEQMGHNVSECENGEQAVHAASECCFDLVLMDIQMPVLDGLSATRRIRELPEPYNKTKIIALTAQALETEVEAALRAGVHSVISKPFSKSTLNYALRAAN